MQNRSQPISNSGNGKRRHQDDHSHKNGILDLILAACVADEPAQAFPESSTRGSEP
jgi:hypothetical protein